MTNRLKQFSTNVWLRAALFSITFLSLAWLSRQVSFQTSSFPTLWFPSGLMVAVLLLSPLRDWPVYLLAALPAIVADTLITPQPLIYPTVLYITSMLEALTGAWLLRRFDPHIKLFHRPDSVLKLILFSTLLACMLSATLSTTLIITIQPGLSFFETWRIAWISHALGVLVVAPLSLSWADFPNRSQRQLEPESTIEFGVLTTSIFVVSLYIFAGTFGFSRQSYVVVPFLVWSALRFSTRTVTLHGFIVTVMASWGLSQQLGGFAINDMTIAPNMDSLGSFLAITIVTCYILATVLDQFRHTASALRESEARYRLLIENQGEGVAIVTQEEIFSFANPAAEQIFGVQHGQLVGRSLRQFTDKQQFEIAQQQTQLHKQGIKNSYEMEITQPGGARRSLIVTATAQYDEAGEFTGTFAVFHDNTERKQAEVVLRENRLRYQMLFDHSPVPIWEEDYSRVKRLIDGLRRDGVDDFREHFTNHPEQRMACAQLVRVIDVNQAVLSDYGFTEKAAFLAQSSDMLQRGPHDIFLEELVAIADGKTEFEMEGPNDLVDGVIRYHYVRWVVAPGHEKTYRRMIVSIIDVTERKQAEDRMRYLSTHDVLTGLYNRNFFEAELERLQNSRVEPINVMVVDINGMKDTNDEFGHAAGDDLLRRTAQVLKLSFRKEDVIARIGGDEFVVLFSGQILLQDAIHRVKECLADHNHWYEGPALSLAIGAATGNKGVSLMDLYKKADQLMYKEKTRQRRSKPENRVSD